MGIFEQTIMDISVHNGLIKCYIFNDNDFEVQHLTVS